MIFSPCRRAATDSMLLPAGKSDAGFRDDNVLFRQSPGIVRDQPLKRPDFDDRPFVFQAEQNNAMMRIPLTVDFLAKVLVIGHQDAAFRKGFSDNVIIIHVARLVIYREHFMLLSAQPCSDSRTRAFVHDEAHLCRLDCQRHKGCVFERFCGKKDAGLNIFPGEP
jgi:hypothetical protein